MRILFVTPYVPSPIRVRPFNFIKHLSRRHDVTLICLMQGDAHEEDALALLRDHCRSIYALPIRKFRSLLNCCCRLLTNTPLQAAYTELPEARDLVTRAAESGEFDLLHVEHLRGAYLASGTRHIPRVYDSVDCITRLLKQRLHDGCGPLQRLLSYEELLKMRLYEPKVAETFDSIIITSESDRRVLEFLMRRLADQLTSLRDQPHDHGAEDRRMLRRLAEYVQDARLSRAADARVQVVPNGVDSEYFRPLPLETRPGSVVFSGKMGYFANVSAVEHFYRRILPRIREKRPHVTFKIVGSDPAESVRRLASDPCVEVTGYVPDIRPHLARADVVVCPLTVGVGIQNKMLEAMAMSKAVVATCIASRGIPGLVDRVHMIRADDPERFADAVITLLDNPELSRRIGQDAREFVMHHFSWDVATRSLETVHERAVGACQTRLSVAA